MEDIHAQQASGMTERMLLRAFLHMGRVEWHERVIAGCTPSEIRVMLCIRHGISPESSLAYGQMMHALRDKIRHEQEAVLRERIEALRAKLGTEGTTARDMKVSQISRMLGVTSPAVTQIIKGLEAKGLVEREDDAADKRMVNFRLTLQGDVILSQAIYEMVKSIRGLMDYLGEAESAQLAASLMKAFSYFSERAALNTASQWNGESEP